MTWFFFADKKMWGMTHATPGNCPVISGCSNRVFALALGSIHPDRNVKGFLVS